MLTSRMLAKRAFFGAVTVLVFLYVGDYLSVRIRMIHPKPADPFESITVPRVLAIPEKGNKTSYEIDQQNPEQTIVCVHALFPHSGDNPCWYVKPRINQPIPMTIFLLVTTSQAKNISSSPNSKKSDRYSGRSASDLQWL
jgi:hypothetical protein